MIEARFFTKEKFQDVKEELLDRMACLFGHKSEELVIEDDGVKKGSNKRRKIKDTIDEV